MRKRLLIIASIVCCIVISPILIMMAAPGGQKHKYEKGDRATNPPSVQLPLKYFTLPLESLMNQPWYLEMQRMLANMSPSSQDIILLSCNYDFLSMLLNWLVAFTANTDSDLSEVIVLAMDDNTNRILTRKGFNSVYISNSDIFISNVQLVTPFSHIWMKRFTVTRLLNRHGYNIVMFDLDAIVLGDIVSIMKSTPSDIIGSMGKYPYTLGREWGFTLCMGVAMFKSSTGTELFWSAVSGLPGKKQDDQVRTNEAFKQLNISWSTNDKCSWKRPSRCTYFGTEHSEELKVTLLSSNMICRSCNKMNINKYYVWHNHSSRNGAKKEAKAKKDNVWYLRNDWRILLDNSKYKGIELIKQVQTKTLKRKIRNKNFQ